VGEWVVATANADKHREFQWLLRCTGFAPAEPTTLPYEVAEDPLDYRANAAAKARAWARATGRWAIGDDTGLEVDALDGSPGPQSARFAGPTATASQNCSLLLERLTGVAIPQRGARFVCYLAVSDPLGEIRWTSCGQCRGFVLEVPRGDGGFGYDSLLWLAEYHATLAELPDAARWLIGHRGRAWIDGAPRLRSVVASSTPSTAMPATTLQA
jgi:XTP/dITP diphosphohydrolase